MMMSRADDFQRPDSSQSPSKVAFTTKYITQCTLTDGSGLLVSVEQCSESRVLRDF